MVEYSKKNVKLTDTQMQKLKNAAKNKTETTLRVSLKVFDEIDLRHELLLTTRQIAKLRNAFNNNISTDIKLSEAQIFKIIQSGRFIGSLLSELASPLMAVAVPLEKNIFAPLGKTAATSAIDVVIQKKIHCPGRPFSSALRATTLIISDKEMNDIIKIV